MKLNIYFILTILLCCTCLVAFAQKKIINYEGTGYGLMFGEQSTISVKCEYQDNNPTTNENDYQKCWGVVTSRNAQYSFYYEDWVTLPPYKGWLQTPQGNTYISIYDFVSYGEYKIESGRETFYGNEVYGEFKISWRRTN